MVADTCESEQLDRESIEEGLVAVLPSSAENVMAGPSDESDTPVSLASNTNLRVSILADDVVIISVRVFVKNANILKLMPYESSSGRNVDSKVSFRLYNMCL